MGKSNQKKGNAGEELAVEMLAQKGFRILHRNWRFSHKEIDIVCLHNNYLVIVECLNTQTFENFEVIRSNNSVALS